MSRYALNKVLWLYGRDAVFRTRFDTDAAAVLAGYELSEVESAALAGCDIRAVFSCGAHPFLVYSFAIALNRGWSMDMMKDYVAKLEGLELQDIET